MDSLSSVHLQSSYIKAPICPSRVAFNRLLSKFAYKVDFLLGKLLLYIRFLLYVTVGQGVGRGSVGVLCLQLPSLANSE